MTDPEYSWWQARNYCYICGLVSRIPVLGFWLVRRHLLRQVRKGT